MLVYGPEGIGKTTFATKAPNPILIQTEDGLGLINVPHFPLCETYDEVIDNLETLASEGHDYKTVVIDSMDWLEKLASTEALKKFPGKSTLKEIGYGVGEAALIPLFEKVLNRLNTLRNDRKMNVVLVAHAKIEKIQDSIGAAYDEYSPRLEKRVNGFIKEWPDIIGFASQKIVRTEGGDIGFNKKQTVVKSVKIGDTDRILQLTPKPGIVAKNRYKLPDEMPLDGDSFFQNLWGIIYPKKSTKGDK